ncbi:hypothetical protein HYH03_016720 [Edaphochlamys debaryana]|uniref:Uncharacterized protein n=1 Tax=Edaphochlamys debaryana TaxID=47281 RepID=A0A835XI29_9CHLO|nr:hypothetical protein HYH03_016720 [Edaphochlamys debaryana]|eukprot:KAG2484488.1 hypothetical protein HYH03_016720 [Edaphochlamys debaryana]
MPTPKAGETGEDPFGLRPHAPISVVRAAKASLKEPTRPVTPADYGRQLFSTGDPGNRPSTSYLGAGSKGFYQDGGPKLALPKLDTGRPDTQASGMLRKNSSSSSDRADPNRPLPGLDGLLAVGRGVRPTAAETVAALKSSLGEQDFSFPRPAHPNASPDPHAAPASSGAASLRAASLPSTAQSLASHAATQPPPSASSFSTSSSYLPGGLAGEFSYGMPIPGEGEGPLLDPRRNDDLPPRPGTSRGRPGSAALSDMDPITERYPGPPPGVQELGNGAQVLDMAAFAQYSDDEENDFDGAHAVRPPVPLPVPAPAPLPHGPHGGQLQLPPDPHCRQLAAVAGAAITAAAAAPGSPARASRAAPPPVAAPPQPAVPLSVPVSIEPVVLDPSDDFFAWRTGVEGVLTDLTASIAARSGTVALCGHAGRLLGLVEEARRREHSSAWLNSSSAVFREHGSGSGSGSGGGGVAAGSGSRSGSGGAHLSMRDAISEHVFRLMDSSSPELLMKACAIVLRVVKSRQPLLQTAKLLYRLSKEAGNDALFRREGLLEPLVHTVHIMVASARGSNHPGNMHEPLVYLNGALKNVSNDASNQKALVRLGSLHVLAALLNQLADQAKSGDEALAESCGQVAVQASGVLRNLAVPPHNAAAFLAAGIVPALRAACAALSGATEVVLNVGRILSKLSLHDGCQAAMEADGGYAPLLVQLLGQYADHRAILLRVAFVLGNLTTNSSGYREQVCNVPFSLVTVVGILQRYAFGGPPPAEPGASGSAAADRLSKAASHEDCLVKILRLAANLAIWPDAGHALAEEQHVADALLALLEGYSFEAAEELVLNTVCALTNLSYYQSDPAQGFVNKVLSLPCARLLPRITPLLLTDNEEAVIEAARVYGNFSRSPDVRDYMQAHRIVEALVLLLDHPNSEVLYSVCGTLINFTMDPGRKAALGSLGGASRLVEVLGRTVALGELTERDEAIVDVVCKALFNVASADEAAAAAADAAAGSAGAAAGVGRAGSGGLATGPVASSFSHEEVVEVLAVVEVLEASSLAEAEETAAVLGRLGAQMRRLRERMSSAELEALPE